MTRRVLLYPGEDGIVAEVPSLKEYPDLTALDIQACLAYGAEMSRERYVSIPLTSPA